MNVTTLENELLGWIALNEMTELNGDRPERAEQTACWFWASEFAAQQGIKMEAARAVASSLKQKGLAYFDRDGSETCCMLSEEGLRVWAERNPA